MIRRAGPDDVDDLVRLSGQARRAYAEHQPVFWREAAGSDDLHRPFLASQIVKESNVVLVDEREGRIVGFVLGSLVEAPPVYDPGGLTCVVDDFAAEEWASGGRELLDAASREAKARGAAQTVVVVGHHDEPKRRMLREAGFAIASEWHVKPL